MDAAAEPTGGARALPRTRARSASEAAAAPHRGDMNDPLITLTEEEHNIGVPEAQDHGLASRFPKRERKAKEAFAAYGGRSRSALPAAAPRKPPIRPSKKLRLPMAPGWRLLCNG